MHGRPRPPKGVAPDPAQVQATRKKADLLRELTLQVLRRNSQAKFDPQSLALSEQLVALSPEAYTAWNYRKRWLQGQFADTPSEHVLHRLDDVRKELKVIETALKRNPKAYCAWQHRKWVHTLLYPPPLITLQGGEESATLTPPTPGVVRATAKEFLEGDLSLLDQLLQADPRNFHAWGYRRWLAGRLGLPPHGELHYTAAAIEQNFSNYSAWHYRSLLLPLAYPAVGEPCRAIGDLEKDHTTSFVDEKEGISAPRAGGGGGGGASRKARLVGRSCLEDELEIVHQAIFTEPEDQSAWIYHRWVLSACLDHLDHHLVSENVKQDKEKFATEARRWVCKILTQEVTILSELSDLEAKSKWPLLNCAWAKGLLVRATEGAEPSAASELHEVYHRLARLDPDRRGYYTYMTQGGL